MKCECDLCPTPANSKNKKVYSSISQLEEHIIQVHVEGRSSDPNTSNKKAIKKHSALLWQCTLCSGIFVGPQDLEAHSKVHDAQNEKEIGNEIIRIQTNSKKSEHQYDQPCLQSKTEIIRANNELQLLKCRTKNSRSLITSRSDTDTGLRLGFRPTAAHTLETQQQEKLFQHQQPNFKKTIPTFPTNIIQNNQAENTSVKAAPPTLLQNCSNSSSKPNFTPHAILTSISISTGSSIPLKHQPELVDLTFNDPDADSAEQDQDPLADVSVAMELEPGMQAETRQTEVDEPTYHLDPNLDYDPSSSYNGSGSGSTSPWNSNHSQFNTDDEPSSSTRNATPTIFHYYASELQKPKRIYTKSTACLPLPLPLPGSGPGTGTVPNEDVKIHRRKEANRKASIRYRRRQNNEMENFLKTLDNLKAEHETLLKEKNKLAGEIKLVKSLLRDFLFARRKKSIKIEM